MAGRGCSVFRRSPDQLLYDFSPQRTLHLELLLDCSQRRVVERRVGNIIKPHHRAIPGHHATRLGQGTNGSAGGEIIKGDERSEPTVAFEKCLRQLTAFPVCRIPAFDLNH